MKQILQQPRTGEISVSDVPAPQLVPGCVLVRIAASLVSVGTERASSEFASKNLLQKAKARPDLVREVVGKVRRDGLFSAMQAVRSRLDQPLALGYSSAGRVVGIGEGVTDIRVGDRVACAGTGYAVHAEVACVPRLLVAKLPEPSPVTLDEAAFATLGSVALHGIRTADVKLGDTVAVIGLGLLGQLTVQILKAGGCRVLGMDIAPNRAELASRLGADATTALASEFRDLCYARSRGAGVDAVLITAETQSSDPVNLAAEIARDRGIVVAVGMVGMDIERRLYYEKELDFRISRSYGPGRYDAAYEQKGHDYPIGYVRWTETRNMEEFLELLTNGKLDLKSLITHRFPIDRAQGAYDLITGRTGEQFLGVLITYPEQPDQSQILELAEKGRGSRTIKPVAIGLLGAGSFAVSTLLPAIKQVSGVEFVGVCNATGVRGRHAAEKFGFQYCTTDEMEILNDVRISTVLIATRHHLHARQAVAALNAGKHVFCEKPLCLSEDELADVVRSYTRATTTQRPFFMVGFNRRFAPMALRMKAFLSEVKEPLAMHYRVNAGYLPPDHWVHDPEQGGGRILGEVCHFVDFLMFLASSSPVEVQASSLANPGQYSGDNVVVSLRFANGSQGTIGYLANGDKSFSKERVEVFGGGAVAVLEDFRRLELVRRGKKQTMRARWRQDKGHRGECEALANAIRTGQAVPIPFDQIVGATLATLRIQDSLALGRSMSVDVAAFVGSVLNSTITNE
ncbi:MAG: bi-domain-containing oxidoreductase [Terriglobales bacterium]|jgi:predicted dehydrogenase/threonine dehydrogenase-like Zn-dependent dehydrogenase